MSDQAYDYFRSKPEPGICPIALSEFESGDDELLQAKADGRSTIEYYFTCSPSLIRYGFRVAPEAQFMTYLDSDLWFFSPPDPIYDEAKDASAIIIPHRFPAELSQNSRFGTYNVGWVTFRRDEEGLRLLEWWRQRCLEWCFDRLDEENKRFADQRYLDQFPALSRKVCILSHRGADLAPWNMGGFQISEKEGHIFIDGEDRLIFFHFHGVKPLAFNICLTGHRAYRAKMSSLIKKKIYRPYLREFYRIENDLGSKSSPLRSSYDRTGRGVTSKIKSAIAVFRALRTNSFIWAGGS